MLILMVAPACEFGCGRRQRLQESVLRKDLSIMRRSIDDFFKDKRRYPNSLDELVKHGYIRKVPIDPITEREDSWISVRASDGALVDIKSGARGVTCDGNEYSRW